MYCYRFIFIGILWLSISFSGKAQYAISTKLMLGGLNFENLSSGSDSGTEKENTLGFNYGLQLDLERYLGTRTYSIKLRQGLFANQDNKLRSYSQINFRYRLYHRKHALSFSVGPSWFIKPLNEDIDPDFKETDNFQYKLVWLSGEIEYEYYLSSISRATISLNHIEEYKLGISAGVKFFFNVKGKDCNCPSFSKFK